MKGYYEYKLTKRNNKIVTRKVWHYSWTIEATNKRMKYHSTKHGKTYLKLPIIDKPNKSKEGLLSSRPFSQYHYKLLNNVYSKENRILKQVSEQLKKPNKITNCIKESLYKLRIVFKSKIQDLYQETEHLVNLTNEQLRYLNKKLSTLYNNYHHLCLEYKQTNNFTPVTVFVRPD